MAKSATGRKLKSRSPARKSAARRPLKPAPPAKRKSKRPHKQTFVASHLKEAAFEQGLRSYAKYRALGIAAATGGMVQAHVIKMTPPCDPAEVSKPHYHDVQF